MARRNVRPLPGMLAPLRVAVEVRALDRGGLETVVAELVRGLPAEGVAPVVVCTEAGGALADQLRAEGHEVEILTGDDRRAELAEILRRRGIQLVNAHYSTLGTAVAASLRIPVVATIHNAYAWLGAALYEEFRTLDPDVAGYIAVSESVADFSARRFHIERDRIAVVRNGARSRGRPVDAEGRARARRALGIPPDAELVLQVGSVSRVKAQLATVEAVARLAASRPRLVARLVGAEAEPDYAALVRQRIADRDLGERVVLSGLRSDVDVLLDAADVFVLPSLIEGLSVAAVEALRSGVPAVLTRTGDADFLFGADSETRSGRLPGALIDGPPIDPWQTDWRALRASELAEHPPHAGALAAALEEVLDDLPARREAARERGAVLAGLLSPEEMCRQTASVLLRVTAAHATHRAAELDAQCAALERQRTRAVELLEDLGRRVEAGLSDSRTRLDAVLTEARTASRTTWQVLQVANRILDKLRLGNRLRSALRSVVRRSERPAAIGPRVSQKTSADRGATTTVAELARHAPRAERWLILAVVPFDDIGGAQRSAQLARALVRGGHHVTYVARFPRSESVDLGVRLDSPRLELRDWDPEELRRWIASSDERLLVLVEVPEREVVELAEFARKRGARVLYDKIDAWESCDWASWYSAEVEDELARGADDLVASATVLQRRLESRAHRPVELVPNAVDRSLFRRRTDESPPEDLVRGVRTLVYAGSLWGDWFDWGIVAGVARARPGWEINLIGDPPHAPPQDLPANVRFVGLKPQAELPSYYAAADACLIPFTPGPVVDAVNPLKVYEYLAMHRPVVATSMPELRDVPYVFTADDVPSTIAAVEQAASTAPPVSLLEDFLAENTWEKRIEGLAAIVAEPTIAIIVLCYNNEDVIGRCIESLVQFRGRRRYDVIVVDNGSTDASVDIVSRHEQRGEVILLRNDRNGCSSGRNLGLRASSSEIVVFLDSDQWVLREGWLDPALEILREHRKIGAVGWNAGWFDPGSGRGPIVDSLQDRGMTGRHRGKRFRTDVAYLATSGLVAPRSVLARTSGFDEFYDPTCFEDTDLSFQIKALGYDLAYCPSLAIDHRPHQTTGSLDGYGSYFLRNERYFLDKWRRHPDFFFGVPPE